LKWIIIIQILIIKLFFYILLLVIKMSESEPDYKSRLNPLNKLTIVSGAKSQIKDAQGNTKRKYSRTNIRIKNSKSEKLADTFGTPLSTDKIKSGDFSDNMKWNVYKTDIEPQLMNRMVENDDESMQRVVEAALVDDNIHKAEIKNVDQATLDRQRANRMYKAHVQAKQIGYLSEKNNEIERRTEEALKQQLETQILALNTADPLYEQKVERIKRRFNNRIDLARKHFSQQVVQDVVDLVKNKNIAEFQAKKAQRTAERDAEKAAKKADKDAKKSERDAEKAKIKAEKAAKQQAQVDAKAAKLQAKTEANAKYTDKLIARGDAKRAQRAEAKAKYDARVAKREAKQQAEEAKKQAQPAAAVLLQNALRNSKARKELASRKQTAEKYNEFLGEREEQKKNLKAKSANLTARYGEALFPRAKVGRPPGSKNTKRTGQSSVLRGMVAKGKKPVAGTPAAAP